MTKISFVQDVHEEQDFQSDKSEVTAADAMVCFSYFFLIY
jgi:hypothetical protein